MTDNSNHNKALTLVECFIIEKDIYRFAAKAATAQTIEKDKSTLTLFMSQFVETCQVIATLSRGEFA